MRIMPDLARSGVHGPGCLNAPRGELRRNLTNCEMRTLVLTDASGEVAPVQDGDPLAFLGGYAWKEGAAAGNGGRAM